MQAFDLGQLHLEVLDHIRVQGENFPTPEPGSIGEYFVIDGWWQGKPINLYPNQVLTEDKPINRLSYGWVGPKFRPRMVPLDEFDRAITLEEARSRPLTTKWIQDGVQRGADPRNHFFEAVARRFATAYLVGLTQRKISTARPADLEQAERLIEKFVPSIDTKTYSLDGLVRRLTGNDPREGSILGGTTVALDTSDTRRYRLISGVYSETTGVIVGVDTGSSAVFRASLRWTTSSIPRGAAINTVSYQVNISSVGSGGCASTDWYGYSIPSAEGDVTTGGAQGKYDACGTGTSMGAPQLVTQNYSTTGSKTASGGGNAIHDIEGCLARLGRYAIGMRGTNEVTNGFSTVDDTSDFPTLTIDYTAVAALKRHPGMMGGLVG